MNYTLTTPIGHCFVYVMSIHGIFAVITILYSAFTLNFTPVIIFSLMLVLLYFKFYRRIFRFKTVTFNDDTIIISGKNISLADVNAMKQGIITYLDSGREYKVYYNHYFGHNYELLVNKVEAAKTGKTTAQVLKFDQLI
ncbi:MAG TPA: hypothetical protein VEA37_00265 [Flavobacterium sp.]|nr:hypothetical protein [Flavobacterium sp.]